MEQEICRILGKSGCYFFCLLRCVGRCDDAISIYKEVVEKDWMDPDCYVKDPCAILNYLTGKKHTVKKSEVLDPNSNIVIGRWYNPTTNHSHFVVMDSNNNVTYDPLGESITVASGAVESYRLFYECK